MEYNGIKFISADGFKLSDEEELEIEEHIIFDERGQLSLNLNDAFSRPVGDSVGKVSRSHHAGERYLEYTKSTLDVGLEGLKVVVDCANGAASRYTPRLLEDLGASVTAIHNEPDGRNINAGCGSTCPETLAKTVVEVHADVGLAHDGDADRLIAVDEKGNLVDGDHIMAICGLDLLRRGMLPKDSIVATVYSNLGLSKTFAREGGNVVITKNGDRYVLEEMRKQGVILGGEQSGHIIFLDRNTTGDGLITALALLSVLKRTGASLSELASCMDVYPQVLVNVNVRDKEGLFSSSVINEVIEWAKETMGEDGRIFVRPSGTESLIRVLGEGPDESMVREVVSKVASIIEKELG